MRETLRRLLKLATGYGAVQWAGPVISFIFTPILTRILLPDDYGVNDYVMTIASGVGTLTLFGLPQALLTHFNDSPDEAWRRHITGSALVLTILISLPCAIVLVVLAPQIAWFSFQNSNYVLLFQLVGATLISGASNGVLTYAAQAALRVRWGMVFSLTTILATALGNIVFIILLRWGVLGMVLVPVCSGLVLTAVIVVVMRPMIGAPQRALMGQLLKSGAILVPATASAWILQMVDRLFLVHYVSVQELGYYAIANRIAALLFVLMAPIYSAWTPLALAIKNQPQAKQRFADIARYLIAVSLTGALFLGLFATEILIVMTRAPYLPAAPYIGFLAYVQVLSAIGMVLSTGAMAGKQLAALSWTVLAAAAVNLVLNFLLIPSWGLWGATIATLIGYGVQPALLYVLIQRYYPIPYPTRRIIGVLAVQMGLMFIGLAVPPLAFPLRVAVKSLLFLGLPLAFVVFGIVTPFELKQARLFIFHRTRLALTRLHG